MFSWKRGLCYIAIFLNLCIVFGLINACFNCLLQKPKRDGFRAVIISPTRELANQVITPYLSYLEGSFNPANSLLPRTFRCSSLVLLFCICFSFMCMKEIFVQRSFSSASDTICHPYKYLRLKVFTVFQNLMLLLGDHLHISDLQRIQSTQFWKRF